MLHFGVCFLIFSFQLPLWVGSFLSMFGVFKKDSFTLVVASQSLLGRWVEHLTFCSFSGKVGSYLGRGATWVVGLVCF